MMAGDKQKLTGGAVVSAAGREGGETGASPFPAAGTSRDVLVFRDVFKKYPGVNALAGVSLHVPRGEIIGLIGANGAGKSTLLKLAAGLVRPTKGEITVAGERPGLRAKSRVAYMPEVDHLYPWMTVPRLLNFMAAFYDDWDEQQAQMLVETLELPTDRPVGKMSKGQRARARFVAAFGRPAPLVLLDEPLSGIDPISRSRIVAGIVSSFRPEAQSVIISTHDILETEQLFDRVVVVSSGVISLDSPTDALRSRYGKSLHEIIKEVL